MSSVDHCLLRLFHLLRLFRSFVSIVAPYVWTWADDRYLPANCFTLVAIDAEMTTTSRRRATLYMTLHICINVASSGGPKG
jgi:hypothetical protein